MASGKSAPTYDSSCDSSRVDSFGASVCVSTSDVCFRNRKPVCCRASSRAFLRASVLWAIFSRCNSESSVNKACSVSAWLLMLNSVCRYSEFPVPSAALCGLSPNALPSNCDDSSRKSISAPASVFHIKLRFEQGEPNAGDRGEHIVQGLPGSTHVSAGGDAA